MDVLRVVLTLTQKTEKKTFAAKRSLGSKFHRTVTEDCHTEYGDGQTKKSMQPIDILYITVTMETETIK